MKLTPLDIRHKDFKRGMRGYVDGEVDEFLDEVADEFERLFKENIELAERIDGLQEKINQYRNLEETLQNTLVAAQRSAEELKSNAQKEAQLILSEAELKARQMVNDSYADKQGIEKQIVVLKSSEEDFRFKFRSLLEGYLKNLAEIEKAAKSGAGPADAERIKQAMAADQAKHAAAPAPAAKPPLAPAPPAGPSSAGPQERAAEAAKPADTLAGVQPAPGGEPRPAAPMQTQTADQPRPSSRDEAESDDLLADVEDGVDDNEFKW